MQENLQTLKRESNEITDIEPQSSKLLAEVAVSSTIEDYENKPIVFSFEAYNQGQCRIFKLDKTDAKHLTSELKKISRVPSKNFRHQHASGIACKPVSDSGNYSALFNGLPSDAELLEIDYTKAGRIFGYIVKNIFNIVAVAKEHLK